MRQISMNSEPLYWLTNKSWYRINREKDCFEILDSAPVKAWLSLEIWFGKRKISKRRKLSSQDLFRNLNSPQRTLFLEEVVTTGTASFFVDTYGCIVI